MNFRRIFANALARRLAALVVAAVLAWLGLGEAHAMDQGEAYALAEADRASYAANLCKSSYAWTVNGPSRVVNDAIAKAYHAEIDCVYSSGGAFYLTLSSAPHAYVACPADAPWDELTHTCKKAVICTAGSTVTWGGRNYFSGTTDCQSGCQMSWSAPDASGMSTGTRTGQQCDKDNYQCPGAGLTIPKALPSSDESSYACQPEICPEGKEKVNGVCKDKNTCPAGQHINEKGECEKDSDTCPAGQTKGPDGSCVDDGCHDSTWTGSDGVSKTIKQVKGQDGTCKADADNDGKADDEQGDEADNEDGKKFSGGDSCDAPPSCSGDVIQCGQARIQWRIDCNTRKLQTVSGGACSSPPQCTGKGCGAVEVAHLMQQWKTACELEKLNAKGTGTGDAGQPEWTKVTGMSQDPGQGAQSGDTKVWDDSAPPSMDDLDKSGFGGGQCGALSTASGAGAVSDAYAATFAAPPPMWCEYVGRLKAGLLLIAACVCAYILSRG